MNPERQTSESEGIPTSLQSMDSRRALAGHVEGQASFMSAVGRRMGHFVLEAFMEGSRDSAMFRARRVVGSGDRVVAVKLLRTGSPAPETVRLFDEERRSLASLDHPAIPRLLGSGITSDGWSWFAKEYVLGWPLVRHAEDEGLGLAQRVELMIEVCRAVGHAHERKVIHPELHAASLMITTRGEPKVVGFGLPGLPTGKNVAELGELLFGLARPARPFLAELRSSGSRTRMREGRRAQQQSARKPAGGLPLVPRALQRPRSDIDRVCLKAVGYGPWEVYRSAADLADDLERVLEGRPVSARHIPLVSRIRDVLDRLVRSGAAGARTAGAHTQGDPSPSGPR